MLAVKEIKTTGTYVIQNYDELKNEVAEIVKPYTTLYVNSNNLQEAKNSIAKLNKVSKLLNDTRIKAQKEYLEPFNIGKGQFDELITIISEATNNIKSQIDELENERKKEKKEQIQPIYDEIFKGLTQLVEFAKIYDEKWENKTFTLTNIEKEITEKKEQIMRDINVLTSLNKSTDILAIYFETLDLGKTIEQFKYFNERKEIIRQWQLQTI